MYISNKHKLYKYIRNKYKLCRLSNINVSTVRVTHITTCRFFSQ